MSPSGTAPGAYTTTGAHIDADQVRWLSVEGGGAAGMTVHPGMLHALEDLDVLRWDTRRRQVGVEGFAGSSSGSIIATLASCGYYWHEVATLLSQPAFDLVFRTEAITLGDHIVLNGAARTRAARTGTMPAALGDPLGYALASAMHGEATVAKMFTGPTVRDAIAASLGRRLQRATDGDAGTKPVGPAALLADIKAEVLAELRRRMTTLVLKWGRDEVVDYVKANYPLVIGLLLERLLDQTTWSFDHPRNLLTIFRYDYGFYAGHRWREYIDLIVAFALLRSQHVEALPSIEIPNAMDFRMAQSLQQAFEQEIRKAMADPMAEAAAGGAVTTDYVDIFRSYRNCTFDGHRSMLYDWLDSGAPGPLALTGANLSSQESHVFSADTTPDMCISDAVRISSGLPPVFKPFIIDAGDIPSMWSVPPDGTTAKEPFLVGQWMDGGTFHNSPVEWYRPWESTDRRVLGTGIGFSQRRAIDNVTDYYGAIFDPMARSVYERNVTATRTDLGAFIEFDNFGIGIAQATMSDMEMQLYRGDAWLRTVEFFGGLPEAPPAEFEF